jgi:hypothetical protein
VKGNKTIEPTTLHKMYLAERSRLSSVKVSCDFKSIVIDINSDNLGCRVELSSHKRCNSYGTAANNCDDVT